MSEIYTNVCIVYKLILELDILNIQLVCLGTVSTKTLSLLIDFAIPNLSLYIYYLYQNSLKSVFKTNWFFSYRIIFICVHYISTLFE